MSSKSPPEPGAIVTVSAIALFGAALPRVAVLELDRAVERDGDLWALAQAVVSPPASATDPARVRWEHVLDELAGDGHSDPPIPKLGHRSLLEHLQRALAIQSTKAGKSVHTRLKQLCEQYDALVDAPLNPQGKALIEKAVARFDRAVRSALTPKVDK